VGRPLQADHGFGSQNGKFLPNLNVLWMARVVLLLSVEEHRQ
jgi:hypothetical protein